MLEILWLRSILIKMDWLLHLEMISLSQATAFSLAVGLVPTCNAKCDGNEKSEHFVELGGECPTSFSGGGFPSAIQRRATVHLSSGMSFCPWVLLNSKRALDSAWHTGHSSRREGSSQIMRSLNVSEGINLETSTPSIGKMKRTKLGTSMNLMYLLLSYRYPQVLLSQLPYAWTLAGDSKCIKVKESISHFIPICSQSHLRLRRFGLRLLQGKGANLPHVSSVFFSPDKQFINGARCLPPILVQTLKNLPKNMSK